MAMTVFVMSGLGSLVQAASAQPGDLVKAAGNKTVYYLGSDSKLYNIPNEDTYFSWYKDWSGVITISVTDLNSYGNGIPAGFVTMRPGTRLIKRDVTTDDTMYAVETNGTLRPITAANAIGLYGSSYTNNLTKVSDQNFLSYTVGTQLPTGQYPIGTLLKKTTGADVYYFDGVNYRHVATEAAFNANRFNARFIVKTSMNITAGGTAITGMESNLINAAQNGGTIVTPPTVVTSQGVMVSLSSNTAAANSIINGQALADMASFNFTATSDGAAVIKTIKLKRIGISSDNSLVRVYLYDGATRLTDESSFSNGYVSFSNGNGLMTIPAGQTKTLTVKADVSTNATGNIGVSINAASDIVSTAAVVTGGFPLNGNLMTPISVEAGTMSVVTLTSGLAKTGNTAKAGNTNTIVWSESANVTQKAVDFKYIALKQIGSINADDLANLSLYVDGTKVSTSALNNNDLAFSLATPIRLNVGNHTIEVKADIMKGSSRTFSFSLQTAANAVFTDTNYNINVAPVANSVETNGNAISVAPAFLISSGSLSLSADSTFNETQVVKTATNVTLSRFKLKAYGEDVKINTVSIDVKSALKAFGDLYVANEKINDLAIVVNGTQVGSSKSVVLVTTATPATPAGPTSNKVETFGSNNLFKVPAGTEVVVEIKGSLSLDENTKVDKVSADITAITGQGETSYTTLPLSADPAYTATGKSLSVVSGSMTVAKDTSMQNQNVSKNTQKVLIGSYILSAGPAEGINITNLRVNVAITGGTSQSLNNISNLYVSENVTPVNPQSNNDFNVNLTIAKSQTKTINVYADLNDVVEGNVIKTTLDATYKTVVTQTFGTSGAKPGQDVTVKIAALSSIAIVANDPVAKFVVGGTTATAANYKFVAENGNAMIDELTFAVTGGVSEITVDGKTAPVVSDVATITGLSKEVVAGLQGTNVAVLAKYIPVTTLNQGGVVTNGRSTVTLTAVKYTVNGTQITNAAITPAPGASKEMVIVASYPTFLLANDTPVGMSSGFLAGANTELLKFTVTNSNVNNPVNLKQITVTPTHSTGLTGTTVNVYESTDTNTVIGTGTMTGTGNAVKITFDADSVISTSKTYVVKADTTGLTADGSSIRMSLTSADASAETRALQATGWAWNDSTTNDYMNGYLLKNLPVDGNTMVK